MGYALRRDLRVRADRAAGGRAMKGRPEYARMPVENLGYYGLHRLMRIYGCPDWLWRLYWKLQPIRCVFGFHDFYSTAAGECSGCQCGKGWAYPTQLMHEYRWRPWMRSMARDLRDAEFRAEFWEREYFDRITKDAV